MMKRHKMGRKGWTILAIILYPFVLPILFIWFPQAVTLWLEAWHVLFGFLPEIFPFVAEAEYLVQKHDLSMPYIYYIQGFWLYLGISFVLGYWVWQSLKCENNIVNSVRRGFPLKTDRPKEHSKVAKSFLQGNCIKHNVLLFIFIFCFISGMIGIFTDWLLTFMFEYVNATGMGAFFNTWVGFQIKPLVFVFLFWLSVLIVPYAWVSFAFRHIFTTSMRLRFLRMLKQRRIQNV